MSIIYQISHVSVGVADDEDQRFVVNTTCLQTSVQSRQREPVFLVTVREFPREALQSQRQ